MSVFTLLAAGLTGCEKDKEVPTVQKGEFTLRMDNGVSATDAANVTRFTPLVLNAATYKNANGDDFTVSTFRYYISNVQLIRANGSTYAVPDSYFLVDQAAPASHGLTIKDVPAGDFTKVSFTVGVDSARTKAGNFTGVLDGNNGMLWTMNGPEFINLKLEGRSPKSPTTGLIFHLAGYKGVANNTIRTVTLPFPAGSQLLVRPGQSPEVRVQVDISKLFNGPNPTVANPPFLNPVNFATVYNKMSGPAVAKLADNLAAGMFSVTEIKAN
ncbi:MAG TPA: MbnP family protein [Hymenobacter sp.]|uniref:MbnP family protein n=1 Tax=Hymenobacter sp. TaxID=1898978 RepID=UPI002ED7A066